MIPELVNLSRGRGGFFVPLGLEPPPSAAPEIAPPPPPAVIVPIAPIARPLAEPLPPPEPAEPEPSEEEQAAQAYELFGADDCPQTAEAYALGESEAPLVDANCDPPQTWSDTIFLATEPSLKPAMAHGYIGSTFAFAMAYRRDEQGDLRSPALRAAMEGRGVPKWMLDGIAAMALDGAPIDLGGAFAREVRWRPPGSQQINELIRALEAQMPARVTHIILTPWLDAGGAERVALWHAAAVAETGGCCLVISTDGERDGWASRLPNSAHYLSLRKILTDVGLRLELSADDCAVALGAVLAQTRFDVLHVINSYVGTRMLRHPIDWGERKVFYALYGVGVDQHGLEAGFWFDARHLHGVHLFLSDNMAVPNARASAFGLSVRQFRGIKYPVAASLKYSGVRKDGLERRQVLWASRFDPEKRPELVFEIAERLPGVDFHMFGRAVLSDGKLPTPPDNVHLRGPFDGWESLPAEPFDCFLFTSSGVGEGMPNIILEAMGAGLPIVASDVGAVGEALADNRGWLIEDTADASGYIRALKQVFRDPKEAAKRARAALRDVTRNRTMKHLLRQLSEIGYI